MRRIVGSCPASAGTGCVPLPAAACAPSRGITRARPRLLAQVCLWCYHRIINEGDNKCPNCRRVYDGQVVILEEPPAEECVAPSPLDSRCPSRCGGGDADPPRPIGC